MIKARNKIRRLTRAEMLREVALDAIFLAPAEGRIGEHDVHAVALRIADIWPRQRVVVAHKARVLDAVQQHVRDAEHVRKLFLLNRPQGRLHLRFIFRPLHIAVAHVAQRARQKAARAAGGVKQDFTRPRVNTVSHKSGDSARGVILARVPGRLQVVEYLLVNVAEVLALGQIVEVDAVDLVYNLPHQLAGLHVVVGVLEHVPNDAAPVAGLGRDCEVLQRREQLAVNEAEKLLAGDAFGVGRPGPPLILLRDRRAVIGIEQLKFLILIVDDLEEEHPAQLADALGVAIDPGVLPHNILNRFDDVANGHGLCGFLIESGLQFVHGVLETLPVAEHLDELHRRAERGEGRDAEHVRVVEIQHTFVGIFSQQRIEHGAGLWPVFREDIALLDVFRALAPSERLLVEGNVADEIEGIEVLSQLLGNRFKRQTLGLQFLDDRLLAFGRFPAFEEIVETGEAFPDRRLGEVAQGFGDELAVFVEILHPFSYDGGPDAIDIDLLFRPPPVIGPVRSGWSSG